MSRYKTINDAAHAWVNEFNAVPQGMIDKLMSIDPDDWQELTMPAVGDRVYAYDWNDCGTINEIKDGEYVIELDNGGEVTADASNFEVKRDDLLPMWGTMWSFGDSCDDWWLEEKEGLKLMSECGFRIYENEEFGYFFGIDGAGYDFYEAHWIPLYKARGLQWHDEEAEKVK
jgi:hypothetical protein